MSDDISPSDVTAPSSGAPETAAPSPPTPQDSSAPPSSAPDDTSPSSGDSRQSDREGLLAVVKSVVKTEPEPGAVPSSDADAEGQDQVAPDQAAAPDSQEKPQDTAPEKPLADPTEADLKKLRPETRKRFEQLLAQRNEARQTVESVQPELAEWRQVKGYLEENRLAPEDVNTLLGVGAALRRGDYQAFLNGVWPYVASAQEALGLRISNDLQQQVEEGVIDEASARELTRTRHRALQAEARLQDADRAVQTNQQVQHVDQIRGAVDDWERRIQRNDPDYPSISGAVRRAAQGLMHERGHPRTQQEAVDLTQAAYDEVKGQFARAVPAPRPTRPTPSGIHVATGTPSAEPRNLKEVVLMALNNTRRAS